MNHRNVHMLIIDPQIDFCHTGGALSVPGADGDIDRLARLIRRLKHKLSDVHVTLDAHHAMDIAHPGWFVDSGGRHPAPFTRITAADLADGVWTTTRPGAYPRTLEYLRALESGGRYPHTVWPRHCLIGSEGHCVMPDLADALGEWTDRFAWVDYVTKGSNPWTEHFSAVQAEVPDPRDASTHINARFVESLERADVVLLAGEAGSHCLASTVRDIADQFSAAHYIEKLVLLTDATSPVPGFEDLQAAFIADLTARGMKTATTDTVIQYL